MSEALVPVPAGVVAALVPLPGETEKLVKLFQGELKSKRTKQAYAEDLRLWAEWQGVDVVTAVANLLRSSAGQANGALVAYRNSLSERKLSASTQNRRLAAIRRVVRLARMLGHVTWAIELGSLKVEAQRDTRGPGVPAVRRMLRAASLQRPEKAARDIALLRLMFDLALRRSEVLALTVGDLDLERSALWAKRKGKDQKVLLSLPEATRKALAAWLEHRGAGAGALFRNFDRAGDGTTALSGHGLYAVVKDLARRAKIERTRPHGIRHTAISRAMEEAGRLGIPIEEVLAYSGHSKRSLPVLMAYRDFSKNRQGQLAGYVADGAQTPEEKGEGEVAAQSE